MGGLFCAQIVLSSGDGGFVDSCETASSLGNVSLMKPYSAGIKYAGGKPLSFWLRAWYDLWIEEGKWSEKTLTASTAGFSYVLIDCSIDLICSPDSSFSGSEINSCS